MYSLKTPADVASMLEHSYREPVFLYKHSASCPISFFARQELEAANSDYPVYMITVQQSRTISDELAKNLKVKHETPQLILIKDAQAKTSRSHSAIKSQVLAEMLQTDVIV